MKNESQVTGSHVGELLSGYIDGELTQQQRQRVELHCEDCADCARELDELGNLRTELGATELSPFGAATWRETMAETSGKTARGIGWLLLIGGVLFASGIAVLAFLTDPSIELREKLIAGAIYGGLALLLVSVLRQRLMERKTDKYKDVEI